jgi:carboxyl-terminal processing protease
MSKLNKSVFISVLTLFLSINVYSASTPSATELYSVDQQSDKYLATHLLPDRDQVESSLHVARNLSLSHYRKQPINKELSEKIYDHYLSSLDPSRLYFIQSDITEFENYRFKLDSAIKTGQLSPAFKIFNRYQTRVIERLEKQTEFIDKKLKSLNFKKNEFIETDRSKMPWAQTIDELDDIWRRRIKSAVLAMKLDGTPLEETKETLTKRYKNQLKRTLQARSEDAFSVYMNSFTAVYDPHTTYFSPRSSENFNINMSLSLEGIGAVLQADNEFTKVVRLVPGGPAHKQGQLSTADRIVGVAQGESGEMIDVIGWRLDEVVDLIRGPKHSIVRLKVIPSESNVETKTEIVNITRDRVKLEEQAASSSTLDIDRDGKLNHIGVITLPTFYADFKAMQEGDPNYKSTTRDVITLLNDLQNEKPLDGLVIDLRGNGGGSLDEANQLTGLFIDQGPTVQIRSASNRVEVLEDPDPALVYGGPLIVLVDRLSASASEIFAGAIQDYGRGLIMGSPTFGKGTVQSVRPLNHGQLKITQAKFYRISGASTQHKGVVPDVFLPDTYDEDQVGEDSLEHALKWDSIDAVEHQFFNVTQDYSELLMTKHKYRMNANQEYKLLLEEIEFLNSQRDKKQLTLNETIRKAEDEELDKTRLSLINKRRSLKNLENFKSLDEWNKFEEQDTLDNYNKAKDPDFIIKESAEVLVDLIYQKVILTANSAH